MEKVKSNKHLVKQGECISRIAYCYGFGEWETIYNHPENAELRLKRPNPHLLFPGDEIFIPEKEGMEVPFNEGPIYIRIPLVKKRQIRLKVLDADDRPIINQPWVIDGQEVLEVGTTDENGCLEAELLVKLQQAKLEVGGYTFELEMAGQNPIDSDFSGIHGRLVSLGYDPGPEALGKTMQMRSALASFQRAHELEGSGEFTEQSAVSWRRFTGARANFVELGAGIRESRDHGRSRCSHRG